ncbi:MAG TPA: hypothetical protein PLE50_07505, partial [Rhabdaerophilum sp.]|nr:hypothetical protein [Rhabdaerophilum sp.]
MGTSDRTGQNAHPANARSTNTRLALETELGTCRLFPGDLSACHERNKPEFTKLRVLEDLSGSDLSGR